jgi:hypothetical protein
MERCDSKAELAFVKQDVIPHLHNGEWGAEVNAKLGVLRRERVKQPVIFIGITSSSVVAGALKTKAAIEQYLTIMLLMPI